MLYGLNGSDIFKVSGRVEKGIKIHIVGGKIRMKPGMNRMSAGFPGRQLFMMIPAKTKVVASNETRKVISVAPEKYSYNYYAFNYNKFIPLVYAGYNYDDGVFLGSGFTYTTYDFLRKPFAANHTVLLKYSMATEAKELTYKGIYTDILNIVDVHLKFHIRDPKFTQNYFGMGNETVKVTFRQGLLQGTDWGIFYQS